MYLCIRKSDNRLVFITPIYRDSLAYCLYFLGLRVPAYFFSQLFASIAIIHGKFYFYEFMVIKRYVEFIQNSLGQTLLTQRNDGIKIMAFTAQKFSLIFREGHKSDDACKYRWYKQIRIHSRKAM